MLILQRKNGDSILLFDEPTGRHIATVLVRPSSPDRPLGPSRVSIAVAAADRIKVMRGELTTDQDGRAIYVCKKCGQLRNTDHLGPTFDCPMCGANEWTRGE